MWLERRRVLLLVGRGDCVCVANDPDRFLREAGAGKEQEGFADDDDDDDNAPDELGFLLFALDCSRGGGGIEDEQDSRNEFNTVEPPEELSHESTGVLVGEGEDDTVVGVDTTTKGFNSFFLGLGKEN